MRSYIKNGSNALVKEQNSATNGLRPQFKRKLLASAVSIAIGASILVPDFAFAADSVADLQAENERLKQEIEALKKSLKPQTDNTQSTEQAVSESEQATATTASSPKAAAAEEERITQNVLDSVVVTARNREEIAQDVPLPVSVIGGKRLDRDNIVTVNELVKAVPNLGVFGSNPRQTSISIRGLGKNSANDTLEPGVGVIVDGVVSSYVGQSWNDFNDLDRIEVLRGPQGTLLGKNTTLGAINISTKLPSFTPSYNFEGRVGEYDQMIGKFSATGPLVDGLLAYRGSFFLNKQNGVLDNVWQSNGPSSSETWNETNRIGGRLQFLLTPSEDVTARVILDRTQTVENGNKSLLVSDPQTYADGTQRLDTATGSSGLLTFSSRLQRSYFNNSDGTPYRPRLGNNNNIEDSQARPQRTDQGGISAQVSWNLNDAYSLTSVTAYRGQEFDIKNGGVTKFDIGNGGQQLSNRQFSQEVRLNFLGNKTFDYQAGLYYLDAEVYSDDPSSFGADAGAFNANNLQYQQLSDPRYRGLLRDSQDGVYRSYVLNPTTKSIAAFGQVNWHITDDATLTLGLRNTYEQKGGRNKRELDRAGKAITNATGTDNSKAASYGLDIVGNAADLAAWNAAKNLYRQAIGTNRAGNNGIYGWCNGDSIKDNSLGWLINPSYKLNDHTLLYASVARGEKSGAVEFNSDASSADYGRPLNVDPEKALDFEFGFKSLLADGRLLFNANLYYTQVKDYQGTVVLPDPTAANPAATRSFLGNIPEVRARGVEFETAFAVTPNLRFNLSGAYNDSYYEDYASVTTDTANPVLVDYSGRQLHGAPRVTLSYGADYNYFIGGGYRAHFFLNNAYRSGTYLSANQADSTYQDSYTLTDGGIGIGSASDKWEFSLIARNLFDKDYRTGASSYSSSGAISEQPGYGRTFGLAFRTKL
jgi:iron complex outermembrane receptor protein